MRARYLSDPGFRERVDAVVGAVVRRDADADEHTVVRELLLCGEVFLPSRTKLIILNPGEVDVVVPLRAARSYVLNSSWAQNHVMRGEDMLHLAILPHPDCVRGVPAISEDGTLTTPPEQIHGQIDRFWTWRTRPAIRRAG